MAQVLTENQVRMALERAGWRCTRQRLAVYDHLARTDSHPTADELYQAVRREVPHLSLATVYKALEALIASGLATKLATGDGSARYDARNEDHYHFRDIETGRVFDLPTPFDPALLEKLDGDLKAWLRERGIEVTGYRLELIGRHGDGLDRPAPSNGNGIAVEDPVRTGELPPAPAQPDPRPDGEARSA